MRHFLFVDSEREGGGREKVPDVIIHLTRLLSFLLHFKINILCQSKSPFFSKLPFSVHQKLILGFRYPII